MVLKEVPGWARKCIFIGFLLPVLSFFLLQSYNEHAGLWENIRQQNVEIPLLKGQNPVACAREGIHKILNGAFGFDKAINSYDCQRATIVPYRFVCILSIFMIVLGVYMYARGNQLANMWPTDWKPFDEKNVKKGPVTLKLEDPEDKPIKPRDGGF